MTTALPLTTYISQGSTRTRKNRVLSAQFGDGYSQEAPNGTNNLVDEWSIRYENLTSTDRATVWTFLDSVGAWDKVSWTPPGSSSSQLFKVTKDGAQEAFTSGGTYTISFNLRQVFA